MKKSFAFLAVTLLLSTAAAIGQERQPMPVPERVSRTIERLKPELGLSDQQAKEMDPVYTEFYTEMDKLRQGGNPTPEERQKVMGARDEKLKKILSEEQFKKLKELEEQMRQRRPNG